MQTSNEINELAAALSSAQGAMGAALKDSKNPHFGNDFASLEAINAVIKQPLADNELSIVQFPISDESGVGITTRIMHKSGQWLEEKWTMPAVKAGPQQYGSLITYFRRYSIAAIFGIPQTDKDANDMQLAADRHHGNRSAVEVINKEQLESLKQIITENDLDEQLFLRACKISDLAELPAERFDLAFKKLYKKAHEQAGGENGKGD